MTASLIRRTTDNQCFWTFQSPEVILTRLGHLGDLELCALIHIYVCMYMWVCFVCMYVYIVRIYMFMTMYMYVYIICFFIWENKIFESSKISFKLAFYNFKNNIAKSDIILRHIFRILFVRFCQWDTV